MEPIISPVFIYLIGISSNIQFLFNSLAVMCVMFAVIALAIWLASNTTITYNKEDEEHEANVQHRCIKVLKYSVSCAVILVCMAALIPSKQVATAMLISSYVTPDNLHGANEVIKSNLQDYINIIVDGINKVK